MSSLIETISAYFANLDMGNSSAVRAGDELGSESNNVLQRQTVLEANRQARNGILGARNYAASATDSFYTRNQNRVDRYNTIIERGGYGALNNADSATSEIYRENTNRVNRYFTLLERGQYGASGAASATDILNYKQANRDHRYQNYLPPYAR